MPALGLDIGTSKICAIVIDEKSGTVLNEFSALNDTFIDAKNNYNKIQDPKVICEKAYSLVDEAICRYPDITCIGVTGQMHGIVYLDKDLNFLSNLYIWQDQSGEQTHEKAGTTYARHLSSVTGYPMATGYGLTTMYYHLMNGLIPKNTACISTIHGYVANMLSGSKSITLHSSDCASLGLFDIKKGAFDLSAVKKAGMDTRLLPDVTGKALILGRYKGHIPVCIAIGDNQAAFIGSGCDKDILVNIGTGSQISMKTSISGCEIPGIEIRPLTEGKGIFVGAALCGGRAFAVLRDFFACVFRMSGKEPPEKLYDDMLEAVKNMPEDTNELLISTQFSGTRHDPSRRGYIKDLGCENFTPAHLIFGTLKGISRELFDMYISMASLDNTARFRLIGSGNGIRKNPLLKKILEDMFGMKLYIPKNREEASFGAALYALTASGVYDDLSSAQRTVKYEDN
jgi:sedoheptulokinase